MKYYFNYIPKELILEILKNLEVDDINRFSKCKFIENGKYIFRDLINYLYPKIYKVIHDEDIHILTNKQEVKDKITYFKYLYTNINLCPYRSYLLNIDKASLSRFLNKHDIEKWYEFFVILYKLVKNLDTGKEFNEIIKCVDDMKSRTRIYDTGRIVYKKCGPHINLLYILIKRNDLEITYSNFHDILKVLIYCPEITSHKKISENIIKHFYTKLNLEDLSILADILLLEYLMVVGKFTHIYAKDITIGSNQKDILYILFLYVNQFRDIYVIRVPKNLVTNIKKLRRE
jgi:hypothetical protein